MFRSFFICLLAFQLCAFAQNVEVNKTNKTIAVTAQETVTADPDVATVKIGYQNYAVTQKDAYDENVRQSASILKALTSAGVDKKAISTGSIKVQRVDPEREWTPEQRRTRQYEAQQTWEVHVPANDAQRLVDLAMRSGANDLQDVTWGVADRTALQAKAGSGALAKARAIAEQMAQGLGAKLGSLVYASNFAPAANQYFYGARTALQMVEVSAGIAGKKPVDLTLFPEKVKQDATVHAVFAIE